MRIDPLRLGRDAARIAEEVVQHLSGIVGAEVEVTLEITANLPDAASEKLIRDGDTEDSLRERIQSVERGLYVRTIAAVLARRGTGQAAAVPARAWPMAQPLEAVPQGGGQTR